MGRSRLQDLKASTLQTFFDVCKKWGLKPEAHYTYHIQDKYIEFKNGSQIFLKDLFLYPSDPEFVSLGSTEFTGAFIDEAGDVTKKAKNIVNSRLRYKLKEFDLVPKTLMTCNPTKGWIYQEFYKPYRENTLPEHRQFVSALPTDNEHLPSAYIDNLRRLDEVTKQRLLLGNWEYDDDPGRLLDYDAIVDIWTNKVEGDQKYLTLDIARQGKDQSVARYWIGWQCKKVWVWEKNFIDTLQDDIKDICNDNGIPRSHVVADEDGVGGGFVDNFRCKGFRANSSPTQPPQAKEDQYQKVNYANFKTQCAYILADKVNRFQVGEDDQRYRDVTMEELEQLKRKNVEREGKIYLMPKDDIKENIGRSPDHLDTYIMRAYFELQSTGGGTKALEAMRERRQRRDNYQQKQRVVI